MTEYKNQEYSKIILCFVWLITILLFIFSPLRVSFRIELYYIIFSMYISALLSFFFIKQKKNYFDFDTLFILTCSLIFFLSPFFTNNEIFSHLFIVGFDTNLIIKGLLNISNIASLPLNGAIILILISVILTMIAGFIPAKIASRKDPVEALRSE